MPQANRAAEEGTPVRIAAVALRVFAVLLALGWATGNMRAVPQDGQAVVLRFGRVVAVQPSGLVTALPWPIGQIVALPGATQHFMLKIAAPPYLTGDGSVVVMDATIGWRVADPAAYYVAREHVPAALRRLFLAASVAVAALRPLDDFLAVRPERADDPAAQEGRRAVRSDLVAAMNLRLAGLARAGAGLGVEVTGADVAALLPQAAASSFDAVPEATRLAEQKLAAARSDAARTRQLAAQSQDALLSAAHASAAEHLAGARASTAMIMSLTARRDLGVRPGLLDQLYRDRIGAILARAGSVNAVDAKSVSRLILPGAQ